MSLEYLTGTSWSSLILSNISSVRQKQKLKTKPHWHLCFSPVETAQLLDKELEPPGLCISRLVKADPTFLLMHKQGKAQHSWVLQGALHSQVPLGGTAG